jgi:HPt (histidine-containing phosphotransfer) domain-containing protein
MIDWARVTELRDEIGADSFDEVAEMFLEEADEAVARLDASGGAKALEADLHSLKGSALNLGFRHLSTLCQSGERQAAGGDTGVDLDEIRSAYQASKSAFHTGRETALSA